LRRRHTPTRTNWSAGINRLKFRHVVNDVWHASSDNMKMVKRDLRRDFVMPLKCNREVALSEACSGRRG
jgi:hypothetical protein